MDIHITVNVPAEGGTTATGSATAQVASEAAEEPAGSAWVPLPPDEWEAELDSAPLAEGSVPDVALAPPGLEELEFDLPADAADIGPPPLPPRQADGLSQGDSLPPGLEEASMRWWQLGIETADTAPPDPSEFVTTKKTGRRKSGPGRDAGGDGG